MMTEDLNLSATSSFAESLAPFDEVMDDTPIVTPKMLPEVLDDDEELIVFESNVFDKVKSSINPGAMTIPQPPRSYLDLEVGSSGVVCANDSTDDDDDDMEKQQYLDDAEKTSVLVGRDWPSQLTWTVAGAILICCVVPVVIVVGAFVRSMRLEETDSDGDTLLSSTSWTGAGMDLN